MLIALAFSAALPSALAQQEDAYETAVVQGVEAFKAGHYVESAADFQAALKLVPTDEKVRLYLATAYAYQVEPDKQTPENIAIAEKAMETFKQVPADDPQHHLVLKQLASINRNIGRLDEALDYERQALQLTPADPEGHYTIAVIDWQMAYKFAVAQLAMESLKDDGVGNVKMSAALCEKIAAHNSPLVEDAISHLSRAIDLRLNYSDAMVYLNLVYRRRADFDCKDPAARAHDIALAEQWSKKGFALDAAAKPTNQSEAQPSSTTPK